MKINFLAFAVPLFAGFILLEWYIAGRQKKDLHHPAESIANLNVGIAERVTDMLTTGAFFYLFDYIYRHFALFHIEANAWTWVFLFLLTDLLWYGYHRAGHKVNLFWSVHVVHHQSEDFNYTVSTRITVLQAAARSLFWAVLPLLGFPPGMIITLLLVHGAYPFFTHTQLVGKLGVLEYLFVTPSHHRVHHSSNPEYLDKNFGDVLIIWDKLFGTFAKEEATPVYGLTKPLNSYSFTWQHLHFILEIGVALQRATTWRQRWKAVFGKPDDLDPRVRSWLERKLLRKRDAAPHSAALMRFITIQTALTMVLLFFTLLFEANLTKVQMWLLAIFILLSVINTGAMLEQRRWVFYTDYLRLSVAGILCYTYFPYYSTAFLLVMLLLPVLLFYQSLRNWYYAALYG